MVKDLLRIYLPYIGTKVATLAVAIWICILPADLLAQNKPQPPDSRIAQEEDIREAAFLFLFDIGTGPDPDYSFYCLSINSNEPTSGEDPSEALLKRFPRMHRTLRKASECEILQERKAMPTVRDKQSGKPAWMISLGSIRWLNKEKVHVDGTRYCGSLCMWVSTLQATLQDGKWKVGIAPGVPILVSQDFLQTAEYEHKARE